MADAPFESEGPSLDYIITLGIACWRLRGSRNVRLLSDEGVSVEPISKSIRAMVDSIKKLTGSFKASPLIAVTLISS